MVTLRMRIVSASEEKLEDATNHLGVIDVIGGRSVIRVDGQQATILECADLSALC